MNWNKDRVKAIYAGQGEVLLTEEEKAFFAEQIRMALVSGFPEFAELTTLLTGVRLCEPCVSGDMEHSANEFCTKTHTPWKNCGEECCVSAV
jgi:hypothetical protein